LKLAALAGEARIVMPPSAAIRIAVFISASASSPADLSRAGREGM
jgi:hypothetical protein